MAQRRTMTQALPVQAQRVSLRVGSRLASQPALVLSGMILAYIVVLTVGLAYKWKMWGHGFDHVVLEQAIWNTLQGRPFQMSRYNFTDSIMGMDWQPGMAFAVPFYALWPSAYMLDLLQSSLLALGAVPVYLIARDHFGGSRRAGLAWAATYLLYPSLQFVNMTPPWQPRTLAVPCLLWAFRCYEQRRLWPFLALLAVAITTRTDVSLVVTAFGVLTLVQRRTWRWWAPTLVLGLGWFALSTAVLTPAFYHPGYHPDTLGQVSFDPNQEQQAEAWPGTSPQVGYYAHLGKDPLDIAKNILTHPVATVRLMFTPAKLWYLFLMFGTLLFLPLLAPEILILCAPIFLLNLLSTRVYQYTITEQYQALIVPGIVLAAIVGAARLWGWISRRRAGGWLPIPGTLLLAQVALVAALHVPLKNPVVSAFRNHESPARVRVMERMAALIPPEASVAATSFLGPRLMPRQYLYYLPDGLMHPEMERADYVFVDARAAVLRERPDVLERLRNDPRWELIAAEDDLLLYRQRR